MSAQVLGDTTVLGDIETPVTSEFTPSIAGMGMEKTVTVYNPLPHDFRVKYARSVATNPSLYPNLRFAKDRTGLDLSKRSNPVANMEHTLVLKAKSEINLPGDIAQIAVMKLISAIIQTRNADGSFDFERGGQYKGMVPDPHLRGETEKEVVRKISDTMSYMNQPSPEKFTEKQIEELNTTKEQTNDQPAPNPAPGTGVSYTPNPAEKAVSGGSGAPGPTPSDSTDGPEKASKSK